MARNARRTLIVNESIQKRIVVAVTLFPTLALSVAALIVAIFCRRLLGEAGDIDVELPSLVPLFLSVLGFVVMCCIVVLHQALRFSHRIAGPAYRITRAMEQFARGEPTQPIKLREGDFLGEIADGFNAVLASVRGRKTDAESPPPAPAAELDSVPAPLESGTDVETPTETADR